MGAYNGIDTSKAGLLYGGDNQVETWVNPDGSTQFGAPVFTYAGKSKKLFPFVKDVGKIVFDANFVASNSIILTIQGVDLSAVEFATSHSNTMDLLVAAVIAAGYGCALDPNDETNRTLFIWVQGETAVVAEDVTGGTLQPHGTISYTTALYCVGVAIMTQNAAGEYEKEDDVNVLVQGKAFTLKETGAVVANKTPQIGDNGMLIASGGLDIFDGEFNDNASSSATEVLAEVFRKKGTEASPLFSV